MPHQSNLQHGLAIDRLRPLVAGSSASGLDCRLAFPGLCVVCLLTQCQAAASFGPL